MFSDQIETQGHEKKRNKLWILLGDVKLNGISRERTLTTVTQNIEIILKELLLQNTRHLSVGSLHLGPHGTIWQSSLIFLSNGIIMLLKQPSKKQESCVFVLTTVKNSKGRKGMCYTEVTTLH